MSEAVIIGVIGATVGILAGIVGGYLLTGSMTGQGGFLRRGVSPVYIPNDLAKAWFMSVGLSALAGLFPAEKAARLLPLVALRRE